MEDVVSNSGNILRTSRLKNLTRSKAAMLLGAAKAKALAYNSSTHTSIIYAEILIQVNTDFLDFHKSIFVQSLSSEEVHKLHCFFGEEARRKSKLVFESWQTPS